MIVFELSELQPLNASAITSMIRQRPNVFALFLIVMMIQVHFEEKRLLRDFGDEYLEYRSKTKRIIPFIW